MTTVLGRFSDISNDLMGPRDDVMAQISTSPRLIHERGGAVAAVRCWSLIKAVTLEKTVHCGCI